MKNLRLLVGFIFLAACGSPSPMFDGGPGFDGGPRFDGGPGFDTGPGFDGAPGFDAGPRFDGGPGFDGGPALDGGADAALPPGSGQTVLYNFRVSATEADRVLFDSTGNVSAMTARGFVISDRNVVGVTVSGAGTTGHYFTVDEPFTYWDHNTIRLGEINGSATGDGTVSDFELRYIDNRIPRPAPSGTDFFVDASVAASGNGLSEAAAFKTITEGLQAIRAYSGMGGSLWIKAATYRETIPEDIMRDMAGTADQPIYISGYSATPGDNPRVEIRYPDMMDLDPSVMPLIADSSGFGLPIKGAVHTIIQNIQVQDSANHGVYISGGTRLTVMENLVVHMRNSSAQIGFYQNNRTESRLKILDCVVMEAREDLLKVYGTRNLHDGNRVYSATGRGGNYAYYYSGSHNVLRNLDVRVGGPGGQHGFALKGDDNVCEHNLLENSQIWGQSAAMEARHVEVRYNVYRNILARAIPSGTREHKITACNVWGGASYNVFDRIHHIATGSFASFLYSSSDDLVDRIGHHNVFKNSISYRDPFVSYTENPSFAYVRGDSADAANGVAHDNVFYNNTAYGLAYLYRLAGGDGTSREDRFVNNLFQGIERNVFDPSTRFDNNVFWANEFISPSGTGNLEVDPQVTDPENQNFSLGAASPVMNAGVDIGDVVYDFTGAVRAPGSFSIGAFELDDDAM